MNREQALAFLRLHQPMPPDREMDRETIEYYDQVRQFFSLNPDIACLQPFLHSFGDGDGLGIYQLIGDVFHSLPKDEVVDAIADALRSEHRSVRYWNAQLAAEFPSPKLVPFLTLLLKEDDYDLKYAALTALEHCADARNLHYLEDFLLVEQNDELRELAQEVVTNLRGR